VIVGDVNQRRPSLNFSTITAAGSPANVITDYTAAGATELPAGAIGAVINGSEQPELPLVTPLLTVSLKRSESAKKLNNVL